MTKKLISAVLGDRKGISSLEYGVLAIGILTGLALAIATLSGTLDTLFSTTINKLL